MCCSCNEDYYIVSCLTFFFHLHNIIITGIVLCYSFHKVHRIFFSLILFLICVSLHLTREFTCILLSNFCIGIFVLFFYKRPSHILPFYFVPHLQVVIFNKESYMCFAMFCYFCVVRLTWIIAYFVTYLCIVTFNKEHSVWFDI